MSSPTVPTHGKVAAIFRLRPNNFKGNGLNDVTWGTGYSGGASAYFEVVIQTEGTPDKFKWRKDGGGWTENVSITGAAQTLSDGQTITFGATTGHTADDQWAIGNLKDEACTESGADAQITATAKRIINPNSPPTFSDTGSKNVLITDFSHGKATFDGNVTIVTVTGNNGYIVRSGLEKVGYLYEWSLDLLLNLSEILRMGQEWKDYLPGQAGGKGNANSYYIGCDSFFPDLEDAIDTTQAYFLLELFSYDPDQDQTGDRFIVWALFDSLNHAAPLNEIIKEALTFTLQGVPSFSANT